MKQIDFQAIEDNIQCVLDNFFETILREHKKDGKVAVAALREIQQRAPYGVRWGKLVVVSHFEVMRSIPDHVYYVAAAFEFLTLCVLFQESKQLPTQLDLNVSHYPKAKQLHANEGINLVIGDMCLVLIHSVLSQMKASSKSVLQYKQKIGQFTRHAFLSQTTKSKQDIYRIFFGQALHLGKIDSNKEFADRVQVFLEANKKVSGVKLVDTFLGMY